LMRKNIFYNCKEPWESGHRCMGKGKVHYIEVLPYIDEEEEARDEQGNEHNSSDYEQPWVEAKSVEEHRVETKSMTIATLTDIPRFHTFRVCGVL
jgi:hypothetical protein